MLLLVSDSSVLIDLERGGLLESTFLSGHTLVVPDLLFENELKDYNGNYLRELGLAVTELNPDEVSMAQEIHTLRPGLSLEDCFALVCACRANHILLAGDGLLRKEATARNIACRGLLWLLDEMLASGKTSKTAWIPGDKAKGGNDIHISLNETAVAVLRRQLGKHPTRVFTYEGKPFDRAYTKAWQ